LEKAPWWRGPRYKGVVVYKVVRCYGNFKIFF
jgi:hypothetical protein